MKTTVAALVLAGLVGSGLFAQENGLDAAKGEYSRRREALAAARDEAVGKVLATYRGELGTLLANVRPQGKLDYVLAIEKEVERLAAGGGAPRVPAAKEFAHLRKIQWAARQAEEKAEGEYYGGIERLNARYVGILRGLERSLTAGGQVELAKAARAERDRVEALAGLEIVSGPEYQVVDWKVGGNPYAKDTFESWTVIPPGFEGWQVGQCSSRPGRGWTVRAGDGRYVHVLVPEGVWEQFGDGWELVAETHLKARNGGRPVWRILRREAREVEIPAGRQGAALPLAPRLREAEPGLGVPSGK